MKLEESRKQFEELVCREMPSGTVIADPKWWAYKLWRASRENMPKIKLPDLGDFMETDYSWDGENETASDYFMEESCREAIIEAIHEAGYEVE